ncbi:hypothetical protein NM688_g1162 [Phlebia brevispora]|uniref:Uncharacterized protein n=1 Tax=Phlebia brevispora TaxID=194682 RepID=A0ACC1TCK6_9APHY|nr:hypothetical protein NM688_g1162 [Phlebia brevispora]
MAFGPLQTRSKDGVVQTYETALSKPSLSYLCRPEATSVTFDRTGSKLAVTFLSYYPTIYGLTDPIPLAICSGHNHPDGTPVLEGERTYVNSCTMKHGSFGGPGLDSDEYYSAGSDDFCAYIWKIPSIDELTYLRETVTADVWKSEGSERIAFTAFPTKDRHIPVDLSTPLCRLRGHKSIVNTALFHPYLPLILTAGVERHILLHSATSIASCVENLQFTPREVRQLPGPNMEDRRRMIRALTSGIDLDDDANTIALFDEILRSEGETDVFDTRRWDPDSDEEPDDNNSSEDEDSESSGVYLNE